MYNEELEKLIDFALADGELTEKEKQVLYKKAEASGIDLDEFEMVLDAQLHRKRMEDNKNTISSAPKSDKYGEIKKCPSCGAIAQSFQTKCPDCGHEFSNIQGNSSIQKLMNMLDEIESQRIENNSSNPLKVFGQRISQDFTMGMTNVSDKINNRKKEIIRNFPIPNTKDDIIEFLTLAVPNATKKGNAFTNKFGTPSAAQNNLHNEFASVWLAKCEQIVMKAKFSMKDDPATLNDIMHYAQQLKIK